MCVDLPAIESKSSSGDDRVTTVTMKITFRHGPSKAALNSHRSTLQAFQDPGHLLAAQWRQARHRPKPSRRPDGAGSAISTGTTPLTGRRSTPYTRGKPSRQRRTVTRSAQSKGSESAPDFRGPGGRQALLLARLFHDLALHRDAAARLGRGPRLRCDEP